MAGGGRSWRTVNPGERGAGGTSRKEGRREQGWRRAGGGGEGVRPGAAGRGNWEVFPQTHHVRNARPALTAGRLGSPGGDLKGWD